MNEGIISKKKPFNYFAKLAEFGDVSGRYLHVDVMTSCNTYCDCHSFPAATGCTGFKARSHGAMGHKTQDKTDDT